MLLFATSTEPQQIPDTIDGRDWYGAAPYATGYPWPDSQVDRFAHTFSIIQTPDPMPYVRHARCIDVEALAVEQNRTRAFLIERQRIAGDATLYCSYNTFEYLQPLVYDLTFRLFAADWDGSATTQTVWFGHKAWAKQYDSRKYYEVCSLFAHSFNSDL